MSDRPLIEALCRWFERSARDLPWRRNRMRNGYAALVAEMMLQQTQASRVKECFPRFMRAFPTATALARASESDVLAQWQGLGYYRRARHLHQAAKLIVRDFDRRVPSTVPELMSLPGVGRYTAGAIASIVFGHAAPIVDGNVERVLTRIDARRPRRADPVAMNRAETWRRAELLVNLASRPGLFNEALMELGATICVAAPATPRCETCPIARWCKAHATGIQNTIPAPKAHAKARLVHHHAVIVMRPRTGQVLLEQRGQGGMWAGMWQTPTIEASRRLDAEAIQRRLSLPIAQPMCEVGRFTHSTTHRTIQFHVFLTRSSSRAGTWRPPLECMDLPMSSAQRRVLNFVAEAGGSV